MRKISSISWEFFIFRSWELWRGSDWIGVLIRAFIFVFLEGQLWGINGKGIIDRGLLFCYLSGLWRRFWKVVCVVLGLVIVKLIVVSVSVRKFFIRSLLRFFMLGFVGGVFEFQVSGLVAGIVVMGKVSFQQREGRQRYQVCVLEIGKYQQVLAQNVGKQEVGFFIFRWFLYLGCFF